MSTGIYIPTGFGWVAGALLSTTAVLQWQSVVVAKARQIASIEHPRPYADKAEMAMSNAATIFNCKQRAHQNTLEDMPGLIITTLIAGIRYPKAAAIACGIWSLGRIIYTVRYSSGVPDKRGPGSAVSGAASFFLLGTSAKVVYDLVKPEL